jgi:hypothetical protein
MARRRGGGVLHRAEAEQFANAAAGSLKREVLLSGARALPGGWGWCFRDGSVFVVNLRAWTVGGWRFAVFRTEADARENALVKLAPSSPSHTLGPELVEALIESGSR